ncbi:hypothetical protein [Haloplanus pelagicus]|nr:hypothetical protein [Haloplanus sp. HW8-1]
MGALVAGFALFLVVGYLTLFDVLIVDSDLVLISAVVVVGYLAARLAGR